MTTTHGRKTSKKRPTGHLSVRSFVLLLAALILGFGAGVLMWLSSDNIPAAVATGIASAAAAFQYLDDWVSDA